MQTPSRRGFTLIELMLVVTIIGVLMSVAMPEFDGMVRRTKESERTTDLRSLLTTVVSQVRTGDIKTPCVAGMNPPSAPGPMAPFVSNMDSCWTQIDWSLSAGTHFRYYVDIEPAATCAGTECPLAVAEVVAYGDLNLNGIPSWKEYYCYVGEGTACLPGSFFTADGDLTEVAYEYSPYGQETGI